MRTKGICTFVVLSVLLAIVPGMSAAGAVAKADLVVTKVALTQAEAAAGELLRVSVTTRNAGRRGAPGSRTGLFLSEDKVFSKSDTPLVVKVSAPRLGAGESARSVVQATVPAGAAVGTYRLLACADSAKAVRESNESNNCRAARTPLRLVTRSSEDKIDAAEDAGKIDSETALRYRIFAQFEDPRLPKAFRGDDSEALESEALQTALDTFTELSPATQKVVEPYLLPPFQVGSAWSPVEAEGAGAGRRQSSTLAAEGDGPGCGDIDLIARDWKSVVSADGRVRVWWQTRYEDDLRAVQILDAIEKKIYPALEKLMGRLPLQDDGGLCNGPDTALDIALVDAITDTAIRKAWIGCQSPAHILLKRDRPGYLPFVAHELMHALQFSYDVQGSCGEYDWLREATAQWFMDYVSDARYGVGLQPDDSEWLHQAPQLYLDRPEVPLEATEPDYHEYGSYLWFFFVSRFDTENYVRAVWDSTPSMSSLDAVKAPLGGNFDEYWREFVKRNWNQGTVDDYQKWDGLKKTAHLQSEWSVKEGEAPFKVGLTHLTSKYFEFVPDPQLTNLEIENQAADIPGAGVQAIISYADGTEKVEDWSDKSLIELCLKNPGVTKIIVIFSNSNTDPSSKIVLDSVWKGEESICCTSKPTTTQRVEDGSSAGSTAGTPCPTVTGTITYTETDSWQAPPDACCSGSETLTLTYDVRMAPEPDGFGWVDAGSSYAVTYASQQSGHGRFGIAECNYQDSYQGSGAGLVPMNAGNMVEKGDLSPVTGQPATGREVLLDIAGEAEYSYSGTKEYSGCDNPSHDATVSDGPHQESIDHWTVSGDCEGYPPFLWLRAAAKERTLTYECTDVDDETGRTQTVTASVTF